MFNARRLKMNRSAFSAFFVAAALAGNLQIAKGRMVNATVQTASPRVAANRSTPATAGKPVATTRVAPQIAPRPTGLNPQRFNANLPRTIAPPPVDLQRTYAPPLRDFKSCFAALNVQRADRGNKQLPLIQRHAKLSCARWRQCVNDAALLRAKETSWIQRRVKMESAHQR